MFLVEYIAKLEELRKEHGDMLEVETWTALKGRHAAPAPQLAHARAKPVAAFYNERYDKPTDKGYKVVRV